MIIKEDKTSKLRLEDWVCVDPLCGNVNYHWRKVCNKCKTNRDEHIPPMVKVIGRNAAEQSEGIFKAQDWQCKACGNVNWARRQSCNRCHTSKFDLVNMLNQDELEDDDNMSVHSALSALAFPCDNDSGIRSGSETDQEKKYTKLMEARVVQWTIKVVSQFAGVSKEDILAGVVPTDIEIIKDTILAIILGGIATKGVPDSEKNELDNLSKEDRIKLLISKCDIPEGAKKLLPHISLAEFKRDFFPRMTKLLLSWKSNNGAPESILTPPVTPEQQEPSQDESRRIMVSQPNPPSHQRSSSEQEKEKHYNRINPASHPQNQRRSPSPYNNRRSRSPYNQRHSPAPYNHRLSRSPHNMRPPGPYNDRRSPSPHHNRRFQSPHHNRRSISPYNRHSPSRNGRGSPPHHNSRRHSPPPSRHYDGRQYPGPRHYESREMRERRPAPYRRYSPERCASRHRHGFR